MMASLLTQCSAMIQLQPEIIMMRLKEHVTLSSVLQAPLLEQQAQVQDEYHSRPRNLVATQYDIWSSSAPWLCLLLGHFQYRHSKNMQQGRFQEAIYAKYKLPELLSWCQLTFFATPMLSGWCVKLDFHRSLPMDNPFFNAVERGDISLVRNLLAEKEAYVTDRLLGWGSDRTALHVGFYDSFELISKWC